MLETLRSEAKSTPTPPAPPQSPLRPSLHHSLCPVETPQTFPASQVSESLLNWLPSH